MTNFIGFTFLRCYYCGKDLGIMDRIDYCNYQCHFNDLFLRRKKQKRIDVYFLG